MAEVVLRFILELAHCDVDELRIDLPLIHGTTHYELESLIMGHNHTLSQLHFKFAGDLLFHNRNGLTDVGRRLLIE